MLKLNNKSCKTLIYIKPCGTKVFKNKRKFKTNEDAIAEAKRVNNKHQTIHKVVAYKCKTCHMFHIGRNGKLVKNK